MMETGGSRLLDGAAGYYPKEIKHKGLVTAIRLAYKWQSLKVKLEAEVCSADQTETIATESLGRFTTEETHDDDEPEWLPPEGSSSDPLQEVTLVIPSPSDATQLQRFVCQVEETLQASILQTVSSWSGTDIMLKLQRPVPLANMLDELVKMPEVEEAGEKTPVRRRLFSFRKEIEATPRKKNLGNPWGGQAQPLTTEWQAKQHLKLPKLQPQMAGGMVS